jgi:hypothetical protein
LYLALLFTQFSKERGSLALKRTARLAKIAMLLEVPYCIQLLVGRTVFWGQSHQLPEIERRVSAQYG